jgi:exonuclease III
MLKPNKITNYLIQTESSKSKEPKSNTKRKLSEERPNTENRPKHSQNCSSLLSAVHEIAGSKALSDGTHERTKEIQENRRTAEIYPTQNFLNGSARGSWFLPGNSAKTGTEPDKFTQDGTSSKKTTELVSGQLNRNNTETVQRNRINTQHHTKENRTNSHTNWSGSTEWTVGTLNIQGKFKINKRSIEDTLTRRNMDILGVQDLGPMREVTSEFNRPNRDRYNMKVIESTEEGKKFTIAMMWKKSLTVEEPTVRENKKRRTVTLYFKKEKIRVINIYVSPHQGEFKANQREWLRKEALTAVKEGVKLIVIGDLNEMKNPTLDRWSNEKRKTEPKKGEIIQVLEEEGVTDTFRMLHSHKKAYSRVGTLHLKGSDKHICTRIDYILANQEAIETLESADIEEHTELDTDHRLVTASFQLAGLGFIPKHR